MRKILGIVLEKKEEKKQKERREKVQTPELLQ
jgi:hypothetical protein